MSQLRSDYHNLIAISFIVSSSVLYSAVHSLLNSIRNSILK